jgi:hypothetical protein
MAKRTTAEKAFKTIKFVIYCYEKSKPGKEEGTISITDSRHKLVKKNPERHFDSYDEIGGIVRQLMADRASSPR